MGLTVQLREWFGLGNCHHWNLVKTMTWIPVEKFIHMDFPVALLYCLMQWRLYHCTIQGLPVKFKQGHSLTEFYDAVTRKLEGYGNDMISMFIHACKRCAKSSSSDCMIESPRIVSKWLGADLMIVDLGLVLKKRCSKILFTSLYLGSVVIFHI